MKLSDFDYELPCELIAQEPMSQRDSSRMLVLDSGMHHRHFRDILDYLEKYDVIVMNNTRVEPSVISCCKESGSPAEILILEGKGKEFKAMITAKNPHKGMRLIVGDNVVQIVGQDENVFEIRFRHEPDLDKIASMPTPPYIKKQLQSNEQYQTVYAEHSGSVAAPTAGFHFTQELLKDIKAKGVHTAFVTLHVSPHTFLPVRKENVEEHNMGKERYTVTDEAADMINNRKGRLFIVGTTTLKTLESASDADGRLRAESSESDLFIYPGYEFKQKPHGFITNFHLPKSTLLMLVSAYAGRERILAAYEEAIKEKYRFYSLGDSMLVIDG